LKKKRNYGKREHTKRKSKSSGNFSDGEICSKGHIKKKNKRRYGKRENVRQELAKEKIFSRMLSAGGGKPRKSDSSSSHRKASMIGSLTKNMGLLRKRYRPRTCKKTEETSLEQEKGTTLPKIRQ